MKTMRSRYRTGGFTMPELMVAILISILIIGALYSVFSRVQEMFRVGHNQTLVLERGRAVMDMVIRDLEMMRATGSVFTENLNARDFGVEFMVNNKAFVDGLSQGNIVFRQGDRTYHELTGNNAQKLANWVQLKPEQFIGIIGEKRIYSGDFSFFGHDKKWHLFGYGLYSALGARVPNQLVGTLYRYQDSDEGRSFNEKLEFYKSRDGRSGFNKIADGVVHLRLRAISALDAGRAPMEDSFFTGAHVPLYVEVELGILEDTVVRGLEALAEEYDPEKLVADPRENARFYAAQVALVSENMDKLHFFRQLIPVRNSRFLGEKDPEGYSLGAGEFRQKGFDTSRGNYHVFLVGSSYGSFRDKYLADVKRALLNTLESIRKAGSGKGFYVIFYSDGKPGPNGKEPESEQWYHATDNKYNEEVQRIGAITPQGHGTIWNNGYASNPTRALSRVFDGAEGIRDLTHQNHCVDTIWLVSNGPFVPDSTTVGNDPQALPGKIQAWQLRLYNKVKRRVKINTVGFARDEADLDETGNLAGPVLKQIAEENEGAFLLVRPDMSIKRP